MKLNLKKKLLILFLLVGILPLTFIGVYSYLQAHKALEKASFNQLKSINGIKKSQIETYFNERFGDISVLSNDPYVIEAVTELGRTNLEAKEKGYLRGMGNMKYTPYREAHDKYHSFFKHYMDTYGYYDVFLISATEGNVFYTVGKEPDFGTSLVNETHHLAESWKDSLRSGKITLTDTKAYAPSAGAPAQFITTPIKHKGEVIGVIAFQIPLMPINAIMTNREGMGKTGESYLVGQDFLMRSDSFLDPANHTVVNSFKNPKLGKAKTEGTSAALRGESNTKIIMDYNDSPVLSSYTSVKLGNQTWAIVSEIDVAEAFQAIDNLRKWMLIFAGIVAGLVVLLGLFMGGSIANPLLKIADSLRLASTEVASAAGQVSSASQQLSQSSNEQASSIEETSSSLEEMAGMVNNNVDNAENSNKLSNNVSESAENGNKSMKELIASMAEILDSNVKIQNLGKVIAEIGEKTAVIDEIVFQTKLLSFNASVEAERAGEHGRGFAVVAQEVGNLAQMSGKAAQEISDIVKRSIKNSEEITTDNKKKVEDGNSQVQNVAKILEEVTTKSGDVAKSSKEILNASKDQSVGIEQINNAMTMLDKATQENAATAEEAAASSEELTSQADSLNVMIGRLLTVVTGSNDLMMNQSVSEPVKNSKKVKHGNSANNVSSIKDYARKENSHSDKTPTKIAVNQSEDNDVWEKL